MIPSRAFANKTVAVFGLARTGLGAVRSLVAGGTSVIAWDDSSTARDLGGQEGAQLMPWREWPWEKISALLLSPGVPLTHPAPHGVVVHANNAKVPVIGDVELFAREIRPQADQPGKAPVIAITGTNGKSTTTALVGHILNQCGFNAQIGGNIGKSVLELTPPTAKTVYVLEMSSFQIDLTPGLKPDVGVLSNLSPDHIDRHGSMENYAAIKARLMKQTAKDGQVVIGVDDGYASAIFTQLSASGGAQAQPVSVGKILGRGVFVVDGILYDAMGANAVKVMDMAAAPHLPGAHNWQNAALAYGVVRRFISDTKAIAAAIAGFPGLAHRMEDVGHIGKTVFINDSKATNADATARALAVYPDIFWIAGGKPKDGGIESLAGFFPRVRKAYLIGEAAAQFARSLDGKAPYEMSGVLEAARASAAHDGEASSAPAPGVGLWPAGAAYDQGGVVSAWENLGRSLVAKLPRDQRAAS